MDDPDPYSGDGQSYPSSSSSSAFLTPADFSTIDDHTSRRSSQVSSSSSAGQARAQGKRRFACALPGCEKSFNSAGHLARHNRTHTGEKAFPCTWEGCTSRFSRHDNMLQHYRGHINKNPRRRKPASTSAAAALAASTGSSKGKRSSVTTRSGTAAGEPVFIHSTYSSLGNAPGPAQSGSSSAPHASTSSAPYTSSGSQSTTTVYDSSSSASRHHSISPPSSTSSLRALSSTSRPPQPQQPQYQHQPPQQRIIDLSVLPPNMQSGPPLASPSYMERPHTANEGHQDFFAAQPVLPARPVPIHRHSYSSLPAQVTEPVTPLEEFDNPYLNGGSPALSASSFSSSNTSLPFDRRSSYGLPASMTSAPTSAGSMVSSAGSMHSTLQHQQQSSYRQLQYVQQLPPVPSARHSYISTAPQRLFQSPVQVHSAPNTPMQPEFHQQQSQQPQHQAVQHHQPHQYQEQQYQNHTQNYNMGFSYSASPTVGADYPSNTFSTYNTHDPPPPASLSRASGLPSLQLSLAEPTVLQQPPPDDDTTPVFHPSVGSVSSMEEYIDPSYTVSPTAPNQELSTGYVWPAKPLFPGADGRNDQEPLPTSPSWFKGQPFE